MSTPACSTSKSTNPSRRFSLRTGLKSIATSSQIVLIVSILVGVLLRASNADEDPGSVFGKGVAFFLGEHCESTCNRILFNVFCNQTTRRCECLPEYPVYVDNKYCVKAIKIDEPCEFSESCLYTTPRSECNPDSLLCRCKEGYQPKLDDTKQQLQCVPYDSPFHIRIGSRTIDIFNNVEFIALFSLALSAVLILVLFLLVLKLMRNNSAQKAAIAAGTQLPPIVLSDECGSTPSRPMHHTSRSRIPFYSNSIESSPRSYRGSSVHHHDQLRPNSRAGGGGGGGGYFMSNNLGSRHQSLSSLHSQSSFRSCSSAPDTQIDLQQRMVPIASWHQQQQARANCPKHRDLFRKASAPFDPSSPCYPPSYVPPNRQRPVQPFTGHPTNHLSNGFGTMPRPKSIATPRNKSESCLVHNKPPPHTSALLLLTTPHQHAQQQQQQHHLHQLQHQQQEQENHFVPHN